MELMRHKALAAVWAALLCASCTVQQAAEPTAAPKPQERPEAPFAYDGSVSLNATAEVTRQAPGAVEERVEFDSPLGGRVAGLLIRPKAAASPPVVLFLHGLGGSKKDARLAAALLAPEGVAVLGLDAACHGDRKTEGEEFFSTDLEATRNHIIQTVVDYRRALDYLATREDLDATRVGLVGASLGAILGCMVTAVDTRIRTCLLIVGGGDWGKIAADSDHPAAQRLRQALGADDVSPLADVDPVRWARWISPRPLWMLNGRRDKIIPAAAARALYEAAAEPKRIIWYDGGHMPPMALVASTIKAWLEKCLFGASAGAARGADESGAEGVK